MADKSALHLIAMGDNCLDVYLTKGRMAVGGNALNVAAHWGLQGFSARYFGVVGDDLEGEMILAALAAAGLNPADCASLPGSTAVTLLRDHDGDRHFVLEDLGLGLGYLPDPPRFSAMVAADWLHLGTNTDAGLVRRLVEAGARFSLDLSTRHDGTDLQGVPFVFASGPELEDDPVAPVFDHLRSLGGRRILLTCGRRGAFYSDGGPILHMPARAIAVVDTCGAGDSFIAAFLAAMVVDQLPPEAALQRATEAAAVTCQHEGGFRQVLRPIPAWLLAKYADVIAAAG
ncbi:PfkB family carbohydrate kinase [Gemmobacter serpentinus]|uniref:PfkB family carbohydrate kinase n=1 Tax=Gemmobacter serpentinus TaxID=2652247 RepID=UPI00124D5D3F|nr:PfkB family carbohydrate kinase [Gemmobacter serpentinus]